MKVKFRAEFFEENNVIVALCPELNVSSFGETMEEAQRSLQEAVTAFIETCEELGTIQEVLEEAGFCLKAGLWASREPVATSMLVASK